MVIPCDAVIFEKLERSVELPWSSNTTAAHPWWRPLRGLTLGSYVSRRWRGVSAYNCTNPRLLAAATASVRLNTLSLAKMLRKWDFTVVSPM